MQNVLVCDDDEAILESLRIYLDNAGFNVITAVDGRDALEKVQNNDIHCVVLDTDAKCLFVDGESVKVTPIEYKIMEYLMSNMGKVLSSSQIYEAVWNEPSFTSEKTVTVHIRNIREKIEINPKDPKYIKVVYGLGYKCEKI